MFAPMNSTTSFKRYVLVSFIVSFAWVLPSDAMSCWNGHNLYGQLYIGEAPCPAQRYDVASSECKNLNGRVCTYEDLFQVFYTTTGYETYNPEGKWLGNMTGDDQVLCGNKAITYTGDGDIWNFEGTCNKNERLSYWCCWGNW